MTLKTPVIPPIPRATAGSARSARRLAKLQRLLAAWWDSVPVDGRRSHYLPVQIERAVNMPTTSLGPALRAMGWRRELVRLAGQQVGIWLAPGAPSIKRGRGRPPVSHPTAGDNP